jgi:hypothetical protein
MNYFKYKDREFLILEDEGQIITIINDRPYWELFEGIRFRSDISTGETEILDIDVKNLIETANWKVYPRSSNEMLDIINEAFGTSFTKSDFYN